MKSDRLSRQYDLLKPEERFCLILAASGRGDETERDRLGRAGKRLTMEVQDHAPYAHAFHESAWLTLLELVEDAGILQDFLIRSAEAEQDKDPPKSDHWLTLAKAAAYVLQTKYQGWWRFCENLSVPAWLLWEELPGSQRLKRGLYLAQSLALTQEGFVEWLNRQRGKDQPEITETVLTVETVERENESFYRQRARFWGG